MGDHNRFQVRFSELHRAILLDGVQFRIFDSFPELDYLLIQRRLEEEGDSFVLRTLPLLGRALDQALVSGIFLCPEQFRRKSRTRLPLLLFTAFSRVFSSEGVLLTHACSVTIQFLRQLLLLDSKLEQPSDRSQEAAVESRFRDCQQILSATRLDADDPLLQGARELCSLVLNSVDFEALDTVPSHGPGAVAEKKTANEKWEFKSWPKSLEPVFPYLHFGKPNIRLSSTDRGVPLVSSETRACFVPKDNRGPRLISVEPAAMQYVQQGIWRCMERVISRHKLTSQSIAFRDQTENQRMCARAAADGFGTIDLSNASDTVSCQLVWYLLSGARKWRRALFHARSTHVVFPSGRVRLYSFAPMGSATCFPSETLVFWALAVSCVSSVLKVGMLRASRMTRVFGDDIIVPEACVPPLLSLLRRVGCEPNPSKTCYETPFRESCGVEYFGNDDVSITRNRHYYYGCNLQLEQYPSILSYNQSFYKAGYMNAARFWLERLRSITPTASIPRVIPNTFVAFGSPDLGGLKLRWNTGYQRFEAWTPVSRQRYLRWEEGHPARLTAALVGSSTSDRTAIRGGNTRLAWKSFEFDLIVELI